MLVFFLANLPLPIILYFNYLVTTKYWRVRRLSKQVAVEKPRRLIVGLVLSNAALIFVLIPIINERRIFIQDMAWLPFFALAATMTITGLALMNSGLGEELAELEELTSRKKRRKPVDTKPSDTL